MDRERSTNKRPDECKSYLRLEEKISDLFPEAWSNGGAGFPRPPAGLNWKVGKLPAYETALGNRDGLDADFRGAEKPFRAEIEAAVRVRCSGRSAASSAEVRYFVAVRGYVVIWFLRHFQISREMPGCREVSETIFPFPDARPWPGIIEWLMIDWWKQHGSWLAALLKLEEIHTGEGSESS
jgi:hypothetical protein